MKLHALACAILGCGLVAATACAPNEAKVCGNIVSIMEEAGVEMSQEECMTHMEDGAEDCDGDYNAALRCMQGADDMEAFAACAEICEAEEEEAAE